MNILKRWKEELGTKYDTVKAEYMEDYLFPYYNVTGLGTLGIPAELRDADMNTNIEIVISKV